MRAALAGLVCGALSPLRLLSTCLHVTAAVCSAAVRAPLALLRGPTCGLLSTAARELAFWVRVVLDGPRIVVGELLHSMLHPSQTPISLCGRRVVSWSEPTSVNLVIRTGESPELWLLDISILLKVRNCY